MAIRIGQGAGPKMSELGLFNLTASPSITKMSLEPDEVLSQAAEMGHGAPRRIIILAPPGSVKSSLAGRLGTAHSLPVFHLDQFYWRPGWIAADAQEFRAEVERLSALPAWIIEGNYTATIGPRLAAADTLIYLDCPSWLCTWRVFRRSLRSLGQVRPDMPEGCPEQLTVEFLRFTAGWNRERRARSLALVETFPGRRIVLSRTRPTPPDLEML